MKYLKGHYFSCRLYRRNLDCLTLATLGTCCDFNLNKHGVFVQNKSCKIKKLIRNFESNNLAPMDSLRINSSFVLRAVYNPLYVLFVSNLVLSIIHPGFPRFLLLPKNTVSKREFLFMNNNYRADTGRRSVFFEVYQ